MRLRDLLTAPPGGWCYRQPETDFWITAVTFIDLARKVQTHRLNNKLPVVAQGFEDILAELEDATCARMRDDVRARICEERNRVTGPQPGFMFSSIIHKLTGRSALTCGQCGQRMKLMNQWGWWGCWRRREEISGWLVEAAAARGHRVSRSDTLTLLRAACKEMWAHRKTIKA